MSARAMLSDADARRRAVTDFTSNLVVLAGAGTGKTSLLVERVLNAVGSRSVRLDELAAITFTEKAAGEMRERLARGLDRLRALARGEVPRDPQRAADRAFAWLADEQALPVDTIARRALEALEQLDAARVSTIHAFCSEVLREHPIAAGVDPDFAVDSGGNAEAIRLEDWERFLARELGPAADRAALWNAALDRVSMGELRRIAFALSSFEIPPELLDPGAIPSAHRVLTPAAAALRRTVDDLLARQHGMTDRTAAWFGEAAEVLGAFGEAGLDACLDRLERTRELCNRLTANRPRPSKSITGITDDEFETVAKAAAGFVRRLREVDDEALRLAVEAVAPFARDFREDLLRRGLVDFDGLIGLTRDLLRDRHDIRRRIKQRFRMLLVDEFQDTDPVQHEIVLLLGEHVDREAADAYATELAPGRLFVVGDAKQSIYRFRGADYASYRSAVDHIRSCGGAQLSLVANFRSVAGIVDSVNAVFASPALWKSSPYQPEHEAIDAVRAAAADGPAVEIWTVDARDGALAEERREAEGRVLAEAIETAVADGRCRYRDIHVLFRAFSSISFYLRPLRERGIPFVVDGGREFLDRPEVRQLIAALRTLALPGDQPALLAFLRSPAGAVSDVELAAYAADRGDWDWREQPDPRRHARIADRFGLLRALRDETRWLPADAVIRRVLERTRMLPLGAAAFEGAQRVANLRKLTESAAELARDGRLSLAEVVEAIESGLLEDIETDRPLSDDAAEAVRITSIHRMKGLENAWVFLPDLARAETRGRDVPYGAKVLRLADGVAALALETDRVCNGVSVLYELENVEHERAEEVRVFYVALTRARDRLIAFAGRSKRRAPWVEALAPWGYDWKAPPDDGAVLADGRVQHRRLESQPRARPRLVHVPGDGGDAVRRWREARQAIVAAAVPPLATPSGLDDEPGVDPQRGSGDGGQPLARATGIVVHRLLEGLPERWTADSLEPGAALDRLCVEIARAESVAIDALRDEVTRIVGTFGASELGRRLAAAEVLGREVPMLARHDDGRTFRGSIDLLYRDADGAVVVADYKTDRDDDEEALRDRYRPQLATYATAVERALGLDATPRAELWLLRSGRRLTID